MFNHWCMVAKTILLGQVYISWECQRKIAQKLSSENSISLVQEQGQFSSWWGSASWIADDSLFISPLRSREGQSSRPICKRALVLLDQGLTSVTSQNLNYFPTGSATLGVCPSTNTACLFKVMLQCLSYFKRNSILSLCTVVSLLTFCGSKFKNYSPEGRRRASSSKHTKKSRWEPFV